MGYAFISYSTKNQSEADAVRTLFIKNNIQTWMAPIDIPAGSKYAGVIVDAIKKCACLVLLLTEESQQSQWVEREVERAVTYRKSIITIQLEDLVLNECFELYIGNQQIVYAKRISETSAEIQKILNAVIALTGSDAEEKKPAPTTLPASGTDAKAQKRQPKQKPDPVGDLGRGFRAAFFGERKNAKDVAVPKQVEPKPENKEPKTRPQKSTTDSNGPNVGAFASIFAQKISVEKEKIAKKAAVQTEPVQTEPVQTQAGSIKEISLKDCQIADTIKGKSLRAYYGKESVIKIPEGISIIGEKAFYANEKIREVYLPDSVEEIHNQAFYGCMHLRKIHFPKTLRTIRQDAFSGCKQLEEVKVPLGATFFRFEKGVPVYYEVLLNDIQSRKKIVLQDVPEMISNMELIGYTSKKESFRIEGNKLCAYLERKEKIAVIPDGVETIGRYAFLENSKIEEVFLPRTLKKIEGWAFRDCKNLKKIHISSSIEVDAHPFSNCEKLETVVLVRVQ